MHQSIELSTALAHEQGQVRASFSSLHWRTWTTAACLAATRAAASSDADGTYLHLELEAAAPGQAQLLAVEPGVSCLSQHSCLAAQRPLQQPCVWSCCNVHMVRFLGQVLLRSRAQLLAVEPTVLCHSQNSCVAAQRPLQQPPLLWCMAGCWECWGLDPVLLLRRSSEDVQAVGRHMGPLWGVLLVLKPRTQDQDASSSLTPGSQAETE